MRNPIVVANIYLAGICIGLTSWLIELVRAL